MYSATGSVLAAGVGDWWLGLRELSVSGAEVEWSLATPLPGWAWVLVGLGALGFAWWAYHRLTGARWLRGGLAGLRAVLVVLVVLLLCGPQLVRREERVEKDVLVMLVDRSASMGVKDVAGGGAAVGGTTSRDEALRLALGLQWSDVAAGLPEDREVVWLGFGENVFALGVPGSGGTDDNGTPETGIEERDLRAGPAGFGVELGEAAQDATRLRTAVEEAVRRASGRPVAGVVVLSDGRSGESVSSGLVTRLKQSAVRVFAVPVGAAEPGVDVGVVRVDAPARAFAGDVVPVSVVVERRGTDQEENDAVVTVRLVDTRGTDSAADDVVLDQRQVSGEALRKPVRMEAVSEDEGEVAWVVEVFEGAGDESVAVTESGELNTENNRAAFAVEIVDRPIRVLYVEGGPRWEYRYLKNLLVREPSIESSILLLSADSSFAQEGDTPITRLPADAREWDRYDVVVIGDVPAAFFSEDQVGHLRDLVSRRGRGLLWVGGPGYTPGSWAGTRLADLLPMVEPGGVTAWTGSGLNVEPTGLAEALSVLRLSDSANEEDVSGVEEVGNGLDAWPAGLPPLWWVQDVGRLKPAAEVLATASTGGVSGGDGESVWLPLVVRMRYGSGQALYVGTDETWRWRRGVGERYPERFWVQLVRMLGRGAVAVGDERARLTASTRTAVEGEAVVLELDVADAGLLPAETKEVAVRVYDAAQDDGSDGGQGVEVRLVRRADGAVGSTGGLGAVFRGVWTADRAGVFEVRPVTAALSALGVSAGVEVVSPDDELRRPEADHEKLALLASATGGEVIPLDRLVRLNEPGVVRSVARRVADDRSESVAHSPLAFSLLLGLLALEWAVRRAIRLA